MAGLAKGAVEQAHLLLPHWVGWAGPAAYLLVVTLAGAVASRLVARLALHGIDIDAESHWTERYQRTHPARIASSLVMLLFPLSAIALAGPWQGPISIVPDNVLFVAASAVAVGSCIPAHLDILRHVLPEPPTLRSWLCGMLVIGCLMYSVLPLTVVLIAVVPTRFDVTLLVWLALSTLFLFAYHHSGGMALLRALRIARPADARLREIVARASETAGVSSPRTFEISWTMVNAVALPSTRQLAFSSAALRHLDDEQLVAIAAHELGHLAEPKSVLLLRSLSGYYPILFAICLPTSLRFGTLATLVPLGTVLLLSIFLRRLSRRLEHRADEHARDHGGEDHAYARALESLYRMNGIPATMYARGTHPQLSDRLAALGYTPSFRRPAPPSRWRTRATATAALLTYGLLLFGAALAHPLLSPDDSPDSLHIALATSYGGPVELEVLAAHANARGDHAAAAKLYLAASALRQR